MSESPVTKVLIIGSGGHARVVAEILSMDERYSVHGFTDADESRWGTEVMGYPVFGGDDYADAVVRSGECAVILGVGDIGMRRVLIDRFDGNGAFWASAIHPGTCISKHATLGKGIVMVAGSIVNCMAEVGDHAIINTNASVGHDCVVGSNVHVAPATSLGGAIRIGDDCLFGIGCRVIPWKNIGRGSTVGAGAVVIEDVPAGTVVVGVPARVLTRATAAAGRIPVVVEKERI